MDTTFLSTVDWVALGTWALALATGGLYLVTRNLVRTTQTAVIRQSDDARSAMAQQSADMRMAMDRQSADLKIDLSVRIHVMMEEKWDSDRMAVKRARLARSLLAGLKHDEIQEAGVMDFFESLAILDRLGLIHRELLWNTFSFYATRWWTACRSYIQAERDRQREQGEPLSFVEFEKLAADLYEQEAQKTSKTRALIEPDGDQLKQFLEDEAGLGPDGLAPGWPDFQPAPAGMWGWLRRARKPQ